MSTVLFDLSALTTASRDTGIGRYVAELGEALYDACQSTPDARMLGIERLSWLGNAMVSENLRDAIARLSARNEPRARHWDWTSRTLLALGPAVKALQPDLLHSGHPSAAPLGELGCPRVVTCHDLTALQYPKRNIGWQKRFAKAGQWLDERRFRSADHVIAVSRATAGDLVRLLEIPHQKISVVHNGVRLSRWLSEPQNADAEVREQYGLAERSYLLYAGSADWRKNPEGMLDALALARKRDASSDLALAWAAELAPEQVRRLLRMARVRGVHQALMLLGFVPDEHLAALYRGALAQLFVSHAEGFGYPVVEAMAAGCPVITSNRSSMVEVAGDAAITVDPDVPEEIAEAILQLSTSSAERQRLSMAGSLRARQFSVERMAAETLDVYRTVISRHRR